MAESTPAPVGTRPRTNGEGFDVPELLFLLSNERRCHVLRIVADRGPIRLTDLTEAVARRVEDVDDRDLSSDERKRTYISITQQHLGRLVEADLLEEVERDTYALGARGGPAVAVLEFAAKTLHGGAHGE